MGGFYETPQASALASAFFNPALAASVDNLVWEPGSLAWC